MNHLLQYSVYSEDTVKLKQSFAATEDTDLQGIMNLAEHVQTYLQECTETQMWAISSLHAWTEAAYYFGYRLSLEYNFYIRRGS